MPTSGKLPSPQFRINRSMKLSCLPVSLYPALSTGEMTLGNWFDLAVSLGLDGADISVAHLENLDPVYLRGIREQANDCSLRIAMLVSYTDFTHPSPQERERQEVDLKRHIEAASLLGAGFVRVTAGQAYPGVERAEGVSWATSGLLSGLDAASQAGVTLAYENHTKGYGWSHNDFSQPADIFLEIVDRTEGSSLGILFDTANNLAHGDNPMPVLEAVKHRVSALHLNDIRQVGRFEPVLLGTGVAPVSDLLRVLAGNGFNGWVSVEEASNRGPEVFGQAMQFARHTWSEVGGR
jgi:sugar phosphate isomerase/epimerase